MARGHHHRGRPPVQAHAVTRPLWERIPYKAVILSFVLASIPFAMGKYFEFKTPAAFDSGAYLYSAHRVLDGAVPGVDEVVTAKAGTLLANMLGVWLFGYVDHSAKLIQMFMQIAALVVMFFVIRRVFGTLAAGVSLFVASFYLSAPLIAKYGNVKEQYLIAFAILGVSMLLMRQMDGRWFWALLAGAFLSWGPMFKETGLAAILAVFIFLVVQPFLRNRGWKPVGADIGLVVLGGILAIAPVQIWISHMGSPAAFNPYVLTSRYALNKAKGLLSRTAPPAVAPETTQDGNKPAGAPKEHKARRGDYLTRKFTTLQEQAARTFRWYLALILPVALALASIVLRFARAAMSRLHRLQPDATKPYERFVLLLGFWWFIDMAFVWVSPRPWEEYYLPLCASGAATGAYIVAMYRDKLQTTGRKQMWVGVGLAGLLCMVIMAWPIFFGLQKSPFTGARYGSRSNGYLQKFAEVKEGPAAWQVVAHFIRDNSRPQDKIYVWGWFPGIYVESQRDSSSRTLPFTSEAHVVSPSTLAAQAKDLVASFEREKPVFLVDTRKRDTPHTYPPLEFWPFVPEMGFLPNQPSVVHDYETFWSRWLLDNITEIESGTKTPERARELAEDEANRFGAMKVIRDYVMANYDVVMSDRYTTDARYRMVGPFATHVLFIRKPSAQ